MSKYVIDAWAWMEYLDGSEAGNTAKANIEGGNSFTNIVTVAEVVSRVARREGDVDAAFNFIVSLSRIVTGDENFAKRAGLLHNQIKKSKHNFSFGDAFVLQTAKDLGAKVLTGDPDFDGIKEAEMLKRSKP